ncbi:MULTISPECIES: hypothetical protein [unclassified Streptomyces]|uniref:hypothetical protein n=1 Tax=unclassified Streptomyces TaxID=2593676 RepID=UPI0004BD4FCE|nr:MULTISPECIES: hypothetical protein [unclassified Streptomyces]
MNTAPVPQNSARPYEQIRKEFAEHPLRRSEVPVEHFVSPPLPTLRWGVPGFAVFASPALRRPRQPLQVDAPDRWWALAAGGGGALLVYATTRALPSSASGAPGGPVTVARTGRPISALREDQRLLDDLLDRCLPDFFAARSGDPGERAELASMLPLLLAPELTPWARDLTPDFFSWLEQ